MFGLILVLAGCLATFVWTAVRLTSERDRDDEAPGNDPPPPEPPADPRSPRRHTPSGRAPCRGPAVQSPRKPAPPLRVRR